MIAQVVSRLPRSLMPGISTILVGLFCLWESLQYDLGTLRVFGPGAFPLGLSVLLLLVGLILLAPAITRAIGKLDAAPEMAEVEMEPHTPLLSVIAILASLFAFTLLVESFGLFPAIFAVVLISALADRSLSLKTLLILAACLAVACSLVFITFLGLPMDSITW